MANLADMIERIVGETIRPDLRDAITSEILSAVRYYGGRRFWFNERRARVDFNTVTAKTDYAAADKPDIGNLISIDYVAITKDGVTRHLCRVPPEDMDRMLGAATIPAGVPTKYAYYGQELRLYPEPDAIYPIRVAGVTVVAAPGNEVDPSNPWMNEAEELIRHRARSKIWANWMNDLETGAACAAQEETSLQTILEETSRRMQVTRLRASS